MAIDKRIDYVDQDGYKNYTKNSDSVTVPRKFKARKNAPGTKLAYITDKEAKQLKKQNPGTPHKGPSNIPSYDSFDAEGSFTSGAAMSAAETGSRSAADRAEVRASNLEGRRGTELPPGVDRKPSQLVQDLRSAAIAAGAGQRVNPGFFDSRNRISPAELARARAFTRGRGIENLMARNAMRNTRGGGIMDFFTGGGFLGNIVRSLGQRFGLGKTYDQPTYDASGINTRVYEATMDPTVNPDYYNDLGNELMLSTEASPATEFVTATGTNYPGANRFKAPRKRITYGDTPVIQDYLTDEMFEEQFGNFNTIKPTNLNDYQGINSLKLETPQQQAEDDFLKGAMAELSEKQLNYLNSPKGQLDLELLGPKGVFEDRLPLYEEKPFFGSDQEPTTTEEFNEYLRSLGLTQTI